MGLAQSILPALATARAHHLKVRVDEMNSVTCGGTPGVSDTFASALWVLETLFALDHAGVSGVNIHMFPTASYAPFSIQELEGTWQAIVHPEYYGLFDVQRNRTDRLKARASQRHHWQVRPDLGDNRTR